MSGIKPKRVIPAGAGGHRNGSAPDDAPSGRVTFDDRGNAVWQWSFATGKSGGEVSTDEVKKLEHPTWAVADGAATPAEKVLANPLGIENGVDPYDSDSGKLSKSPAAPRKKDLRKLGEWLKLRKQMSSNKDE